MDEEEQTNSQKKLDAARAEIQDATDAFAHMAEVVRHVALRFRLLGDPEFMARPTPFEGFSQN